MDALNELIAELEDFGWSPPHAEHKALAALKAVREWCREQERSLTDEIGEELALAVNKAIEGAWRE